MSGLRIKEGGRGETGRRGRGEGVGGKDLGWLGAGWCVLQGHGVGGGDSGTLLSVGVVCYWGSSLWGWFFLGVTFLWS